MAGKRFYSACAALAVTLLALTVSIVDAAPAAAASCLAEGCDGKWPGEQGCRDDQRVVFESDISPLDADGRVIMYRSRACRAVWTDFVFQRDPGDFSFLNLHTWSQPQYGGRGRVVRNGSGQHAILVAGTTRTYRTVLVSWNYSVKACQSDIYSPFDIDPDPESNGGNSGSCSPWQ